ncbi:2TM domain-containing protein [Rhabdothermincola salaria]|uniref:2TM domain-containing protein n=1 Tax=Rhabdothermincola salaria TaxID=2903142 RepID=UPI001E64DC2D|nr:2TM domain-containing protein [Rhabdothermincola salaria]MCD9624863.1 2TM domain-containing protein [Rhabdothermincola salaria]
MTDDLDDPRRAAIARIKARRNLKIQAGTFALLTVVLIVIWAVAGGGFFWPVFPMIGFAFALLGQWQALQGKRPISEDEIRREMDEG